MTKARILIVEDESIVAKGIQSMLLSAGYEVPEIAPSGKEAIRKIEKIKPDLILMDIVLKGDMDGIETAEQINNRFDIPFVYLTAYVDEEKLIRAGKTEPFGYIVKPFGEKDLFATIEMALYKQKAEKKIKHLNLVLRAIRNVNQLIIEEKDPDALIQGACNNFVKNRGYREAWIVIFNESGDVLAAAEAGLGKDFLLKIRRLKQGTFPPCCKRVLEQQDVLVIEGPSSPCYELLLSKKYSNGGAMSVRLEHGGRVYGLLTASVPSDSIMEEDEQSLFKEIAKDLAFALYRIELEEDRKRMEDTVRKAEEEKTRSRIREKFISAATHELRTPLISIKGYIDLVISGKLGEVPNKVRSSLDVARRNTDRLLKLTDDLLDIRRIKSDKPQLNIELLEFKEVIRDCVDEIQPLLNEKKQELTVNTPKESLSIKGDRIRLNQVVMNLLNNANKFTPEGGKIALSVEKGEKTIKTQISDTGIGIRKEDLKRIFEPFADVEKKVRIKGTGLGLSVTKGLIEAHGGKIWGESSGEGKGSVFTFILPKQEEAN